MEEGQGVEEQHEAMRQDVISRLKYLWTSPDLWANIPIDQIGGLVKAVSTMAAPFSRARAGRRRGGKKRSTKKQLDKQLQERRDIAVSRLTSFWANPGLWAKIPGDVIDELIAAVFTISAPFSSVEVPFFSAWEKWRNFRLSMARSMKDLLPHLLYFRNLDECMILNPMTRLWESMPLLFSSADTLRLQHMGLVSCDGGLLYFASAETGELIVGNPLTRRCSATLRGFNAAQRIADAEGKTRKSYDPAGGHLGLPWHAALWDPFLFCRKDIVVNTCVFADLQIQVTRVYLYGKTTEMLLLKDSRSVEWATLADVNPATFYSLCFPVFQIWEERVQKRVILGFSDYPFWQGAYVLLYDIEKQECNWLWRPRWCQMFSLPSSRTLCIRVGDGGDLKFFEFVDGVQDGRPILANAPFPPSTTVLHQSVPFEELRAHTAIPQFDAMFNFVYVQQGDDEYHICFFRQDSRRLHISVREQNEVTGLQRISNWAEFLPSASKHLPSSKQFHIFRPSFSSP